MMNSNTYKDLYDSLLKGFAPISSSVKFGTGVKIGEGVVIAEGCIIEDDVTIGHNCVILKNCKIGKGTKLDHFVLLKPKTVIGKKCFIDSYFKSSGCNRIGNNVTMRFNSTLCREATVEDNCFISPNVMTIYSTHEGEKVGGIFIGRGCHIGTNAIIGPGVRILPHTVIGSLSFVNKSLTKAGTYVGIPARLVE